MLNKLKKEDHLNILSKIKDQIYQIYDEVYSISYKDKLNMADFYVWMVENYCYLSQDLVDKIGDMYEYNNPFINPYYEVDPGAYLYNKGIIKTIPLFSKDKKEDKTKPLLVPKNEYRITRRSMR